MRLFSLPHSLSPFLTIDTRSPIEFSLPTQLPGEYHSAGSMTPLDIQGTNYLRRASPGFSTFSPVLTSSSGSSSPYPSTPPTDENNAILSEPLRYDDWSHHFEEACTSFPAPPQRLPTQPQQQLPQNQHYYPPFTFPQNLSPPFPLDFTNYSAQAGQNIDISQFYRPAQHNIQPKMVLPYALNPLPALNYIDACLPSESWNVAPFR